MSLNIETVWSNILKHENETFYTIKGEPYTYTVYDNHIIIKNIKSGYITKDSVAKSLLIENPLPSKINSEGIWAGSYVYGIITDSRIKYES